VGWVVLSSRSRFFVCISCLLCLGWCALGSVPLVVCLWWCAFGAPIWCAYVVRLCGAPMCVSRKERSYVRAAPTMRHFYTLAANISREPMAAASAQAIGRFAPRELDASLAKRLAEHRPGDESASPAALFVQNYKARPREEITRFPCRPLPPPPAYSAT
jgi:hypothetical protein